MPLNSENISLAQKYNIPLENLNQEFINKSKNVKELEKIVKILRSGQEGHYPHLIEAAEARLNFLHPNHHLLHHAKTPIRLASLDLQSKNTLELEMEAWSTCVGNLEQELQGYDLQEKINFPPIRNKDPFLSKELPSSCQMVSSKEKEVAIKSSDYAAWDKFDVDKELLKIDVAHERAIEKASIIHEKCTMAPIIAKTSVNQDSRSEAEKLFLAQQEKDRGNEFYKAGDIVQAVIYYSRSIEILPSVAAFNNRAMAYLKMQKYDASLCDCESVLSREPGNVKAMLRMGINFQKQQNFCMAQKIFHNILTLEPDNKAALAALENLDKKDAKYQPKKVKRLVIEEISSVEISPQNLKQSETKQQVKTVIKEVNNTKLAIDKSQKSKVIIEELLSSEEKSTNISTKSKAWDLSNTTNSDSPKIMLETKSKNENCKHLVSSSNMSSHTSIEEILPVSKSLSPFEFLHCWRSLSMNKETPLDQYGNLIRSFEPKQLPLLIGSELDGTMLATLLACLNQCFTTQEDDCKRALAILYLLPKVSRFSIASTFLSAAERKVASHLIQLLHQKSAFTEEKKNSANDLLIAFGLF